MVKRHAPNARSFTVVKANAYGHGLLPVARTLVDADAYAVARIEEALMLRSCAVVKPSCCWRASSAPPTCRCWRPTT